MSTTCNTHTRAKNISMFILSAIGGLRKIKVDYRGGNTTVSVVPPSGEVVVVETCQKRIAGEPINSQQPNEELVVREEPLARGFGGGFGAPVSGGVGPSK